MSIYEDHWNQHALAWTAKDEAQRWPGDEWGIPERWEGIFNEFFVPYGVDSWKQVAEIGGGGGKYTAKVLAAAPKVKLINFDVAESFLDVCRKRFPKEIQSGQLELIHLRGDRSDEMLLRLKERGPARKLDALFSMDAMVHVDLQYLSAYMLTAGLTLKQGGLLIMSLADATSDLGFQHMMTSMRRVFHRQGQPSAKFEFLSPDIVRSLMPRFGFEIVRLENHWPGRDLYLVARLTNPEAAESLRDVLGPRPE